MTRVRAMVRVVMMVGVAVAFGAQGWAADPPKAGDVSPRYGAFLPKWTAGQDCKEFFAKDQGLAGRIMVADALRLRGNLSTLKELGAGGWDKPGAEGERIYIATKYCLVPAKEPGDKGTLFIAEEQFTMAMRGAKAFVVDYAYADVTVKAKAKLEELIDGQAKKFAEATPERPMVDRALLAFGQLYWIAEFDRMWAMFPKMIEVGVQKDKVYGALFKDITKKLVEVSPPPVEMKAKVAELLTEPKKN